ncbi:unnamed protein product [Calypogeia fissa]
MLPAQRLVTGGIIISALVQPVPHTIGLGSTPHDDGSLVGVCHLISRGAPIPVQCELHKNGKKKERKSTKLLPPRFLEKAAGIRNESKVGLVWQATSAKSELERNLEEKRTCLPGVKEGGTCPTVAQQYLYCMGLTEGGRVRRPMSWDSNFSRKAKKSDGVTFSDTAYRWREINNSPLPLGIIGLSDVELSSSVSCFSDPFGLLYVATSFWNYYSIG